MLIIRTAFGASIQLLADASPTLTAMRPDGGWSWIVEGLFVGRSKALSNRVVFHERNAEGIAIRHQLQAYKPDVAAARFAKCCFDISLREFNAGRVLGCAI
ncbi:hypothetical protein [Azospirillum argentinense]|uniref:hypothetical protein n=1 Tax=Azospirillum argentinense TaxID=2970906 RepID=UPI0010C09448|nr:hypothetical protein [Azospirillum argentinense]